LSADEERGVINKMERKERKRRSEEGRKRREKERKREGERAGRKDGKRTERMNYESVLQTHHASDHVFVCCRSRQSPTRLLYSFTACPHIHQPSPPSRFVLLFVTFARQLFSADNPHQLPTSDPMVVSMFTLSLVPAAINISPLLSTH